MVVKKSAIEEAVKKASRNGRLSCKRAFALAEKLGVAPAAIGRAADAAKVKIVSCQLGLFK